MRETTRHIMDRYFQRMLRTMIPGDDCIWVQVPSDVQSAIRRWQEILVSAVPAAKLNGNLCIGMMDKLLAFDRDLAAIIRTSANTTPMQAMLTTLETRRVNERESSLVICVDCPELIDLWDRLTGVVAFPVDISGKYSPCIEIARFENLMIDLEGLDQIEARGVKGCKWIIDEIQAGTPDSFAQCALLGHSPMRFTLAEPTDSCFKKSSGMSTLDMESGGLLLGGEFSIDIDDNNDDEDDEESDDAWMLRALDLSESLDGEY